MGAYNVKRWIDQAREAEQRCRDAAARAGVEGQYSYVAYFERMAAYNQWRTEQLLLCDQGLRQTLPTWSEWRGTFNLLPDGQLSLL